MEVKPQLVLFLIVSVTWVCLYQSVPLWSNQFLMCVNDEEADH